jgi:uncharacterized protein YdaU (DUF1376 family)
MGKDPAVLFYTSDFITGTATMSDEQTGKYIRLLCLQHQRGSLTEKDMLFICQSYDEDVFAKFDKDEDGRYFNKRMKAEMEKRKNYSKSRSENRKKGIEGKKNEGKNAIICQSYDVHMENENEDVNINDNTTKEYKKTKKEKKNKEGQFEISVPDYLTESFASFVEMRKAKKSPMTEHAKELMLKKLYELSSDRDEQVAILNQSTVGSWTNIYSLKDNSQYQKPQQREVLLTEVEDGLFKIG